jgi:transcriptional regulator with XRE-family HTH domain
VEETIGERIAALRQRAGWGQRELAKKAGLSPTTVNRLEKGIIEPHWGSLRKLGAAFGISTGELVSPKARVPKSSREHVEELRRLGVVSIEISTDGAADPRGLDAVDDEFIDELVRDINQAKPESGGCLRCLRGSPDAGG